MNDTPDLRLDALAALAITHHVRGIVDRDVDVLLDAAHRFGRLGRRLDRAEALADASRAARRNGDSRLSATAALTSAAFSECDAHLAARRLGDGLAAVIEFGTEPVPAT